MMMKDFLKLALCLLILSATHAWAERIPDTGDPEETSCNPRSYTDLGNGIIRDNVTGLEWQQVPKSTFDTWYNASIYCESLNFPFGVYSDWRLPTIEELATLVDSGRDEPAMHPLFGETTNYEYWSDTPKASSNTAWYINFDVGRTNFDSKTSTRSVRAVRGSSYGSESAFIINADGTVSDQNTGLMWQHCKSGQTWTGSQCDGDSVPGLWDQTSTYIEELNATNHLGYNDWRLPTRNELQSLLDYGLSSPATYFPIPNTDDEIYWSSTGLDDYTEGYAWAVRFVDGYVSAYDKVASLYIRAVRSGTCKCHLDSDCDDDVACNGEEICDNETCEPGTTTCEEEEYCDESIDACVECLNNDHCADDIFCNGAEICTDSLCGAGADPCGPAEFCDEDIDQCVECSVDGDCPDDTLFCTGAPLCEQGLCGFEDPCTGETPGCDEANDQCIAGVMQIDKTSIKAGKKPDTDSIQLSGALGASGDDLQAAIGKTIIVSLSAANIPGSGTIEYSFSVGEENLSNGKYTSPKVKADSATSLTIDSNKGTIKFSAKKVDLTGLSCPITCRVTIGDGIYVVAIELNEDIVNGSKKPCPLPLIMDLQDSLAATKVKAKKSTKPDSDSISVSGTFTIDGTFDMNEPLIITIGTDTFTVPGTDFTEKNSSYSCKSYDTGSGVVNAKFDTVKCTFSISIKSTVVSDSGDVTFGLNVFDNQLWAASKISLPPDT